MRMSHWIGLCFLKPENVSPSCRNIIVSMLLKMNFYIQLLYEHVLTCCRKKLVGGGGNYGSPQPFPMLRPRLEVESRL